MLLGTDDGQQAQNKTHRDDYQIVSQDFMRQVFQLFAHYSLPWIKSLAPKIAIQMPDFYPIEIPLKFAPCSKVAKRYLFEQ